MLRTLRLAAHYAIVAAILWMVTIPCGAQPNAAAQWTNAPQSESIPLAEALSALAEQYQISLIYHPALVEGKAAELVAGADDVESRLRTLLTGTGLVYVRLASGTFALLRERAPSTASRTGTISGRLLDADSGDPIPDVHVALESSTNRAAISAADGSFRFVHVPSGAHVLHTRHVAYGAAMDTVVVVAGANAIREIRLQIAPVPLASLQVEDGGTARPEVRPEDDRDLATSSGTADVVRTLEVLPGVRVDRATSNLHIQGGDVGEHLVMLDGAPVFEPVHLRGLVGAFSPFALRAVSVHGAGFGAALGSQLAGVVTAEHSLGSREGHHLEIRADPLTVDGRLTLDAPVLRTARLRAMTSIRSEHSMAGAYTTRYLRNWNQQDPFLQYASLVSLIEEDPASGGTYARLLQPAADSLLARPGIAFTDLHGAARLQFDNGTYLFASAYRSANELIGGDEPVASDTAGTPPDAYDWQNLSGQVTWAMPVGSRAVIKAQVRHSHYDLAHSYIAPDNRASFWVLTPDLELREIRLGAKPADDGNRIAEQGASVVFYGTFGSSSTLQTGLEAARITHRFRIDDLFFRPLQSRGTDARFAGFVEHELRVGSTSVRSGLRVTKAPDRTTPYVEPRLAVETRSADEKYVVRLAGGLYRQFLNQFDLSSVSPSALMPSIRFWLPVDSSIAPPKAWHLAAAADVRFDARWSAAFDAYLREQPHLLNVDYASLWERLRDEAAPATTQNDFLESARGRAYGAAASVSYRGSAFEGWIRAEVGRSLRTFSFLGDGLQPVPWNEPVALHASLAWEPVKSLRVGASWRQTWGRAWAFRRAYYDYLGADTVIVGQFDQYDLRRPDQHRLPPFQQLDVSLRYARDVGGVDFAVGLDLLNAFDRRNVVDYALDFRYTDSAGLEYDRSARATAPRMLVASVSLAW